MEREAAHTGERAGFSGPRTNAGHGSGSAAFITLLNERVSYEEGLRWGERGDKSISRCQKSCKLPQMPISH